MGILKNSDWFEPLEEVVPENKIVDVGEELDDDSYSLGDFGINLDSFSAENFSIGEW